VDAASAAKKARSGRCMCEGGWQVLQPEGSCHRPHENNYWSIWYGYKESLLKLVGWCREASANPELRSSIAYNFVYGKLLENLKVPD
jgi:hypothetical protein